MTTAYAIENSASDPFASAHEQAENFERYLRSEIGLNASHGELEAIAQREGREWIRRMVQAHLEVRGAAERVVPVKGADGVSRT